MNKLWWILVLVTVSTSSFQTVASFRNDLVQSPRAGCIWTLESGGANNASSSSASTVIPVTTTTLKNGGPSPTFALDCNLRTLNADFLNYTFSRDQVGQTAKVGIKCSDKLFFESILTPNQSLFRLVNLKQIQIEGCKIRKMPSRIWESLGFLKSLSLRSQNAEWSSSVGLEIEAGAFEALGQLEKLDLTENNIWSLPKNIFCPLRNLRNLNLSGNRISDTEELSASGDLLSMSTTGSGGSGGGNNAYCALSVQILDLSFNTLRRVGNNAFSRMRRLAAVFLQNNLLEELEDLAFGGLTQLKQLNISSNRLVALPPSIFRRNPTLRSINLSNNSISALSPQVFFGLEFLQNLDLSKNTLSSQWVKDNMFTGLRRLLSLQLSFNQLSYIDGNIFKDLVSLQSLTLSNNKIETINQGAFQTLSNLNFLDLSYNRIAYVDVKMLSNLFVLRQLYLDHNKIRKMEEDSLKNCTSLEDFGLADNLLQEVPVAFHSASLGLLKTLDIGENRITSLNNESFSGLGQLYGLRMVDNRIELLPPGFCASMKKLRVLNLSQNRIRQISPSAFNACPELRVLRLDTNALEELPPTLAPQLPSLLWLNVSENQLRWADYHLLPPTIEWLDLSYNKLETLGGPGGSVSESPNSDPKFSLRVLDASHNRLTTLDYTTIPPALETLRVNHNRLKSVASDTFIRSTRLRTCQLIGNQLETLPLSSLRFPPVPVGRPLPDFYIGSNPFKADCEMEWLTRVNQLTVLRTHPHIVDLDAIVFRPTFSRPNQVVPLVEMKTKDFLCPYKSHCFALCHCCDFEFCDCEMSCPGNCTCYHDTAWSANIVECSNLNFEDVPPRIPMDATEIFLDGNNMSQLGSHIFIGKKNLRVLFLNDSKVEFIRNKTFNGLKSLEILRLEDNLIQTLHGYEFSDLENLRELYVQNNLLRFIAKETFVELKFIQVIRLDGNFLIDFNVWELSRNGYLNSLQIAGNPWTCDCEFLIPFRTWVASKTTIVADFTLANCQTVNSTHVVTGSSSSSSSSSSSLSTFTTKTNDDHSDTHVIPNPANNNGEKLYPIHMQHPITSMCNHNPEMNFNFNPIRSLESEILNNHISAMAGGAEKVSTIPHPTNDREIQFGHIDSVSTIKESDSMNTFWSLLLSFTALIVLVVVIVAIFRKEIYYWIYTAACSTTTPLELRGISSRNNRGGFFSRLCSLLFFCCGESTGKKSSSYDPANGGGGSGGGGGDDSDKLFDAYFIYSKKDSEILTEKIAPELETQCPPYFRLCLHYRDLCLSPENPWNTDMILSACDASKRVVLVLSRTFLQSELAHSHFRAAIQSAINRHQKKLILILLPPFTEQNLSTIYPELKNFASVKSSTLEWTDKNFWCKLKLILPTPSNINTFSSNTMGGRGRRGSSLLISGSLPPGPLIDLQPGMVGGTSSNNSNASNNTMSSYTINRLDFPYSSGHQYHRNILPYQIPISNCSSPPVPKHHIALTTPFLHQGQSMNNQHQQHYYQSQQNFSLYNGSQYSNPSQHYFVGNNNLQNFTPVVPGGGGGGGIVYPVATLPHPPTQQQHFSFNESFRRHLHHQQQNHHQTMPLGPVLQFAKQQPSSGGNDGTGYQPGYQPLEPNYSSSAISSSAEELEHVYSTLDSPMQSPHSANTTTTSTGMNSTSVCSPDQVKTTSGSGGSSSSESANKLGNSFSNKRNGNSNSTTTGNSGNGKEFSSQPQSFKANNLGEGQPKQQTGNNGQMYFV